MEREYVVEKTLARIFIEVNYVTWTISRVFEKDEINTIHLFYVNIPLNSMNLCLMAKDEKKIEENQNDAEHKTSSQFKPSLIYKLFSFMIERSVHNFCSPQTLLSKYQIGFEL